MNQKFPDASPSKGNLVKNNLQNLTNSTKKTSSTIWWRKSFLIIQPVLAGILLFSGCKDPDELGLNVLPPGDQLQTVFSDTSTLITTILQEDSLQTDELSLQLLGCINDPTFGISTASIYTQVNLAGTPAFGTNPVADSIVLVLGYNSFYGDSSESQSVNVYQLTTDMSVDSTYYSNANFAFDPTSVGSTSYIPSLNPVLVGTDSLAAHIRIKLDTAVANRILSQNGQSTLNSNAEWLTYFKGLKIESGSSVNPGKGGISILNFFNSTMTLYFHNDNDTAAKKYNFSLVNARVNNFTHNVAGSVVEPYLSSGTTDSLCFVQGMSGVKTKISMPHLKHFIDSGSIVVNKAELKITAQGTAPENYPVASRLFLTTKSDAGLNTFPIDYFESSGYFGGDFNTSTNTYTFNIARQVQGILDGTYNNSDFYLVVASAGVTPNRVVIGSSTHANYKMKLSLYYTKIN
jgi:hypothetical protein